VLRKKSKRQFKCEKRGPLQPVTALNQRWNMDFIHNGRFRAECLDQEWFTSLQQEREMIEAWRLSYNSQRPHSSLGYLPPDVWTEKYHQQQQNLSL